MADYKWSDVGKIMSFAIMGCPLCKDPYRTKGALRNHLNKEHTKIDIEKFLKKHKCK